MLSVNVSIFEESVESVHNNSVMSSVIDAVLDLTAVQCGINKMCRLFYCLLILFILLLTSCFLLFSFICHVVTHGIA